MKILICDDNELACMKLREQLEAYGKLNRVKLQIESICSGEAALDKLKGESYHVLFLNIEMSEQSGIQVGKRIREELCNYNLEIVYISAECSYAMELFEIKTFDFLLKPVSEENLFRVMDRLLIVLQESGRGFSYYKKGKVVCCPLREIYYFESQLKKTAIVTVQGRDEFYGSLKQIYEELKEDNFFYCHKSLLINYQKVRAFHYDKLLLENGEEIEISQAKRKEIRQLANKWRRE